MTEDRIAGLVRRKGLRTWRQIRALEEAIRRIGEAAIGPLTGILRSGRTRDRRIASCLLAGLDRSRVSAALRAWEWLELLEHIGELRASASSRSPLRTWAEEQERDLARALLQDEQARPNLALVTHLACHAEYGCRRGR